MKQLNIVEDVLIVAGVGISLVDLQTIMGIILLAVQLGLILFKGIRKILESIKKKDADGVEQGLNDIKDGIESITPKDKSGDK